jgi:CRISPR-associated endonuclease/helicase Cas3
MFSYLKNEKDGLLTGQFLALCVASHHSGMIDCLSPSGENVFDRRMEKSEDFTHTQEAFSRLEESQRNLIMQKLSDEKIRKSIITTLSTLKENSDTKDTLTFKFGLLIRFIKLLIDAERIDTPILSFLKIKRLALWQYCIGTILLN